MLTALALLAGLCTRTLLAQVPAVVASTQATLASGISSGPAVTDACGNVYINQNAGPAGIVQISASTGAVNVIIPNTNTYNASTAIYMDRAKAHLYVAEPHDEGTNTGNSGWYSSEFTQIPITNCTPGAPTLTFGSDISSAFGYYYGTAQDVSGDAAGDVFFSNNASNNGVYGIAEEVYTASSNTYAGKLVVSGSTEITAFASDAAGNLYYSTGNGTVNFLAAPYTGTPSVFSSAFKSVAGLSFDNAGNLYISDGTAGILYEAPLDATTSAPSAANLYAVASVGLVFKVGFDASDNIYLSNYYPGAVKLNLGSATATATPLGSTSGSFGINYIFNAAVTPTSITAVTGTSPSTTFSPGTGGCVVGTGYTVLGTCTVNATFTSSSIGEQTGAILFTSSAGTVITNVSGVGQGPAVTIDPGTVVPTTTTLTAPNGITIDNLGNVYVTDSSANTLTEFAAGSNGVGTLVATGTVTLNAPSAVAVDNLGDIFIANTGANQVIEIPVINGILTNASTAAVPITLKNPEGVATDGAGNLYIADTGDNNLLFVPSISGALDVAAAGSYGVSLNGPSAVTVDPANNVYVAEAGNKDLLEFAAPLGSSAQIKVASGLNDPTSLATDASGSVYVVDSGSASIFRYANVGGNLGNHTLVGSTLANPTGVAVDAAGNLYATDKTDDIVAQIQRITTALQFGGWNVGTTSTPFTATVNNSGNESLVFKSPSYTASGNTAAGFTITTDGCAGTTDLPGNSCDITATFTPPVPELNAQENLTLNSTAANGSPVLQLVGTGAHITPSSLTLALTSPAGATSLNAGQPVTFTATVNTNGGTATPGGNIKFYINGSLVGTQPVVNAAASITLANGLPAGTAVVVSAVYSGDVINYSGSTAQITEDVIALPDTLMLTLTPEYTNPNSSSDNTANAAGPVVPLTATVVPSTTTIPTGTVTFYAGTNVLGIKQVLPLPNGGGYGATLDTTALRAGTTTQVENGSFVTNYTITATYSGDNTYYPSTSNGASIAIVAGPVTQPACATSTPATCNTNTTGAFYTISPTNPTITATTSTAGGPASGSTTLTLSSYGGYDGLLNFTCSGLPAHATCAPFPGYPTVLPSTPTANVVPSTVDFIINTNVTPIVPTGSSMVWWFSGVAGFLLLLLRRRIKHMGYLRGGRLFTIMGALLLFIGSVIGLGGCGSGAYSFITPPGTSTITVKVSSAQLNLPLQSSTPGATYLPDPDPTTFQITLIVK
jgi:trimeric autotransporter adhesin